MKAGLQGGLGPQRPQEVVVVMVVVVQEYFLVVLEDYVGLHEYSVEERLL